jgi:hypothetical protein
MGPVSMANIPISPPPRASGSILRGITSSGGETDPSGLETARCDGVPASGPVRGRGRIPGILGFFGEFGVEEEGAGGGVATAPFGFHVAEEDAGGVDAEGGFPFGEERGEGGVELGTVPGRENSFTFVRGRVRAEGKVEVLGVQFDDRRVVFFVDLDEVTAAPDGVAFAVEVFAGGFTGLGLEFGLLFFDPVQFGDGVEAEGVHAHPHGSGEANAAGGRVDAQVDIFDVLENDFDGEITEVEGFSIHFAGR